MTTADLIREHLGHRWWDGTHTRTEIQVLLDRVMEASNCERMEACILIQLAANAESAEAIAVLGFNALVYTITVGHYGSDDPQQF